MLVNGHPFHPQQLQTIRHHSVSDSPLVERTTLYANVTPIASRQPEPTSQQRRASWAGWVIVVCVSIYLISVVGVIAGWWMR
jgi:hypothetical protein